MIDKINEIYKKHKNTKFSIDWKPRKGIFSTSSGHLNFNPETFEGYSYNWYKICAKINDIFVLNTYGYSSTTIQHVHHLMSLFQTLKVPYVTLEAPRGLQDLCKARTHLAWSIAIQQVKAKYAKSVSYDILKYQEQVELLGKLGVETLHFNDDVASAIQQVEISRKARLLREKQKRYEKRHEKFKAKFEALINSGESHAQA